MLKEGSLTSPDSSAYYKVTIITTINIRIEINMGNLKHSQTYWNLVCGRAALQIKIETMDFLTRSFKTINHPLRKVDYFLTKWKNRLYID